MNFPSASAPSAVATCVEADPAGAEPVTAAEGAGPLFASLMAGVLGADKAGTPVGGDANPSWGEAAEPRGDEAKTEEPAAELLLAGLIAMPPGQMPAWPRADLDLDAGATDSSSLSKVADAAQAMTASPGRSKGELCDVFSTRAPASRDQVSPPPARLSPPDATSPHPTEPPVTADGAELGITTSDAAGLVPSVESFLDTRPVTVRTETAGEVRPEREPMFGVGGPARPVAIEAPPKLPAGDEPSVPSTAAAARVATAGAAAIQPEATPVRRVASAAEAKFADGEKLFEPATVNAPAPPAGTSAAELGAGMKNATEPKEFAGRAQQNLPELMLAGAAVESRRRVAVRPAAAAELRPGADSTQLVSLLSLGQPAFRATEELAALPASVAPNYAASPEPLHTSVLRHVTELRQTGASELAVVLRPDTETQLTLRLTRDRHGDVLVQARCEQGDARLLAANWGEIRHSLAQQGVRLAALEFSPDHNPDTFHPHAGNGGPSPDGQPSSQRHGQPWPQTLDDLPLVGSLTEPPARRGVQRPPAGRTRLLESWA